MSSPNNFFSDNAPAPAFALDDDYRFEIDWIDEDDLCPNCKESLLEHTPRQRVKCALERVRTIGGVKRN